MFIRIKDMNAFFYFMSNIGMKLINSFTNLNKVMKLKDIKKYIQYLPGCIVILYVILVIISQTTN